MNMDKPVRRVAIFGGLLMFGLMAQVNYVQGTQAEALRTHPKNPRQYAGVFNSPRGNIIAGGQVLAKSIETGKSNPKFGRTYQDGAIFSPVTGFFNGNADKVERGYNGLLSGTDKRITQQRWFDMFIGKKPLGANVELALNTAAQKAAYQALQGSVSPGRRGGVVVMDVKTGAVVVMASYPSFDPNEIAPQKGTAGIKRYEELDNAKGVVKPLIDNAMSQTFPPGSSFKTVVAALEMETKGLNTRSVVETGPLRLPESGRNLPNSHDSGACAGSAPLLQAFAESCNTTFGRLALDMGMQQLADGSAKFGFGKDVFVEPRVPAAKSDVPVQFYNMTTKKMETTGRDGTARSGIGQENVRATPLQMAMVAAAVANNGKIMKPYLVERVRAKDQSVLYQANPEQYAQPIKAGTADQLAEMMRAVVTTGTAKNLQGQNIAGKTGTAEQDETGRFNARWFVGFSPMQNPRYAFAVVTEGPGSAATNAGPIAGRVMSAVLRK
ncbi:penicillin-binding transpeptidase domain-containing protein [Actinomadura kijaniata]|uniref:penicillin-binding transpeptidase domain-containing protein n=1 Tax=Actinomadura kijaniata TaxID=46161 RepID=UPI00082DABCD|nr:penicillin-binding transpeptidase domain-containing protein [Actinomadura kijaniata]